MRKILLLGGVLLSVAIIWFTVSNYLSARPVAEENLRGLALSLTDRAQAVEYPYSVGQGFEYSSGKYGTNIRTDTIYAPFTIMASPTARLGLLLEIPFVYQSNGNVVSSIARLWNRISGILRLLTSLN